MGRVYQARLKGSRQLRVSSSGKMPDQLLTILNRPIDVSLGYVEGEVKAFIDAGVELGVIHFFLISERAKADMK